jgi:hypothetical protein
VLRLCDGQRTVAEVVREFAALGMDVDGIPSDQVCRFGLTQLKDDGFIRLFTSPPIWDAAETAETPAAYAMTPQASNTQQPWPASQTKGGSIDAGASRLGAGTGFRLV